MEKKKLTAYRYGKCRCCGKRDFVRVKSEYCDECAESIKRLMEEG